MAFGLEQLDDLRRLVHRDIDESSISLIPPGVITGSLASTNEDMNLRVACVVYGYLLRRWIRGMQAGELVGLGSSYLGMETGSVLRLISGMRTYCAVGNLVMEGALDREAAIRRTMLWAHVDDRSASGMLDETLDIYRRENIRRFMVPEHGLMIPDGEVDVDAESFATHSPAIRLELRRFLGYDDVLGPIVRRTIIFAVMVVLLGISAAMLYRHGHWLWATLVMLVTFMCSRLCRLIWMMPRLFSSLRGAYMNGLLTPGIIEKLNPLQVVCLASMSTGNGRAFWGLKRLKIRELPLQKIKVGEVFPCVSTFTPGAHPAHYADFNPRPISWGTGDALTVRFLLEKLGSEEPGHLRHCFKRDIIPADNQHILLLDGNFAPIEGVDASNQSAPGRG